MTNLSNIFKYNNVLYSEITDARQKIIIDRIISKIKQNNYEDQLLIFKDGNNCSATFFIEENPLSDHIYWITNLDTNTALRLKVEDYLKEVLIEDSYSSFN